MKKLLLPVITAISLSVSSACAFADNIRIGVIDSQQILQKSSQIAAIYEKLTKQFKPRQDKIVAAQKSVQDEINKLNKDGAVMKADERNKLQDKINVDKANVQNMGLAFQRDVATAQNEAMQGFMNQLTNVVKEIAKNNNYDIILQRAGVPFVKESMDVTAQVIDKLNKNS